MAFNETTEALLEKVNEVNDNLTTFVELINNERSTIIEDNITPDMIEGWEQLNAVLQERIDEATSSEEGWVYLPDENDGSEVDTSLAE